MKNIKLFFRKKKLERKKFRIRLFFIFRNKIFFNRRKPQPEKYHFTVHNPFEVLPKFNGLERFHLVGKNWLTKDKKPLAVLYGFSGWKLGFISDYLPEYRTAFLAMKSRLVVTLIKLLLLEEKPKAFIGWGRKEDKVINLFSKLLKIPIYRMEDGFIRSAELGAKHSTPYSLVLDKTGIYYDATQPSDIEILLSSTDLNKTKHLSHKAKECLALINNLNLSKYNQPDIYQQKLPQKYKRRVLVIGQVTKDLSLKFGNPDKWNFIDLIKLAKFENLDAEVLYRPHPETLKHFKSAKRIEKQVDNIATIIPSEIPLPTVLNGVDKVYTISSLSGLEAVLRGIKTVVVGAPFYAGWGLTEDRAILERRGRKLSLEEFFTITYLQYPLYLANIKNPYTGFLSTCYKIDVDREILHHDLVSESLKSIPSDKLLEAVAKSKYWPKLFLLKSTQTFAKTDNSFTEESGLLTKLKALFSGSKNQTQDSGRKTITIQTVKHLFNQNFINFFSSSTNRYSKLTIAYALLGMTADLQIKSKFLELIRRYLDLDVFNKLLCDLGKVYPGEYLIPHLSWLLSKNQEFDSSLELLYSSIKNSTDKQQETEENESIRLNKKINFLNEIFEIHLSEKEFSKAIEISNQILLLGHNENKIIVQRAIIAQHHFDYKSAQELINFSMLLNLHAENYLATSFLPKVIEPGSTCSTYNFLRSISFCTTLKPDSIIGSTFILKKYRDILDEDLYNEVFISMLNMDGAISVSKAQAYISLENACLAINTLEQLFANGEKSDLAHVTYSQALSLCGKLDKASAIMHETINNNPISGLNIREYIRICILMGNYEKAFDLLDSAQNNKIDIGDMLPRKVYFGTRRVFDAFETFKRISLTDKVKKHFKHKYLHIDKYESSPLNSIILLAIFGPGDEIRFASIYNLLTQHLNSKNIYITCEPRLFSLFSKSFKNITFIPTKRPRPLDNYNINEFNNLPSSELVGALDNNGIHAIQKVDNVMVATDMLSKCLPNYESFPGTPYLFADEKKEKEFSLRLKAFQTKKLIGLSWRSSLTTHSRNEHYLTIQELERIFKLKEVQFVNLQYDECSEELAWVEKKYPGKILNFEDLDQYNDFDSVAALMKCLDLVIAPATTVVELAGALGCPTWLLSNSSELHWRKTDDKGTDVWHHSITHIEGDILGDKKELVRNLTKGLRTFIS